MGPSSHPNPTLNLSFYMKDNEFERYLIPFPEANLTNSNTNSIPTSLFPFFKLPIGIRRKIYCLLLISLYDYNTSTGKPSISLKLKSTQARVSSFFMKELSIGDEHLFTRTELRISTLYHRI